MAHEEEDILQAQLEASHQKNGRSREYVTRGCKKARLLAPTSPSTTTSLPSFN